MPEPVPKSADAIQGQMAKIRSDLNADVRGIVENARVITDWKYYVRRYPWACVAGAAALGYLVVPRRLELLRPDPATLAELAKTNRLVVNPQPDPKPRSGTVASLFTFLANTLVRTAVGYMGQNAGKILRAQMERHS
ncbi:MAG: hypothetical protein ABFD16_30065 [Thermoguttaceae bacterium]|jgi:hypothetical protein